ncbi:MAG: cyclic nucleotide-binding domain-containing protein [Treponema sp.]|nr:cyclic nucleotide-binding domain-containing protein [Treponema sp.]
MENLLQLSTAHFTKGGYIIIEGEQNADCFYIVKQGQVGVFKEAEVTEEKDKTLGPGDYFGVISTMSSHSHIETAMALTDVDLIMVHREQYGLFIRKHTQAAMKIITQFSKQLRYLNETLAGIALKKTTETGGLDHLFEAAEYYLCQKQYDKARYIYTRFLKHCPRGKLADIVKGRIEKLNSYVTEVVNETEFSPDDVNRVYPAESMFFIEGEPGNELFVIQKGSVKITKVANENEILLAVLKTGDIFGEMALLENKPRAATAVAYEECKVMVVSRTNFEQMIQTQTQLISKVTSYLADRIWLIYKQLANTLITNPVGRMYDSLLIQLEKNRVLLESPNPYTFSFGQWELVNMVGLPRGEAGPVLRDLLKNTKIQVIDNKIHTSSVQEIVRQTEYYRKMDRIGKPRPQGKS